MLVRGSSFWPMKMIRTFKPLRTLLFMISSGIIVDSMYLDSESVFWLFKPLKKYIKRTHSHVNGNGYGNGCGNGTSKSAAIHHFCHHKKNCDYHILQVRKFACTILNCFLHFSFTILKKLFSTFKYCAGFQDIFNGWNSAGSP